MESAEPTSPASEMSCMTDKVFPASARRRRMGARLITGVVLLTSLVLAVDLVVTNSHSARGATTAGLDVGNLSRTQLTPSLTQLQKRAAQPVTVRTPSGTAVVAPHELGLTFDADATAERLMRQPRSLFDRVASLFGRTRDVEPVVNVDRARLSATLDARKADLEKAAVEGGVRYRGATPVAEMPSKGLRVVREGAADELADHWLDDTGPIDLPMEPFSPTVSADTVRRTVDGPATRATSASLAVTGTDGARTRLSPDDLGAVLRFVADGRGGLVVRADEKAVSKRVGADLGRTERAPVSATFRLSGGSPQVVPARDGARIDWRKTTQTIVDAALADDRPDTVSATYLVRTPKVTTDKAKSLGVKEVVSEFTTGGFSSASGENIRLVAEQVDGAVVLPGETFSLNSYTGPRGEAQGYVTSTIIDHGRPSKAVGGGISQFATTLYNASYFAGLEDVDHTEHSYYISRYPEAREATVFEGAIDLVFRNNTRHGILIETGWTTSGVTVRMWSTKTVDVESITGDRYAYTSPSVVELPRGDDCLADNGIRGFTTSNTRVISDAATGAEISRHTRTVKYDPEPIVRCV